MENRCIPTCWEQTKIAEWMKKPSGYLDWKRATQMEGILNVPEKTIRAVMRHFKLHEDGARNEDGAGIWLGMRKVTPAERCPLCKTSNFLFVEEVCLTCWLDDYRHEDERRKVPSDLPWPLYDPPQIEEEDEDEEWLKGIRGRLAELEKARGPFVSVK